MSKVEWKTDYLRPGAVPIYDFDSEGVKTFVWMTEGGVYPPRGSRVVVPVMIINQYEHDKADEIKAALEASVAPIPGEKYGTHIVYGEDNQITWDQIPGEPSTSIQGFMISVKSPK